MIVNITALAWTKAHKGSVTSDDECCQIFSTKRFLVLNLCAKNCVLVVSRKQKENELENLWNKDDLPRSK